MKLPFGLDMKDVAGIALVAAITVAALNRLPAIGPLPSGKKLLGTV